MRSTWWSVALCFLPGQGEKSAQSAASQPAQEWNFEGDAEQAVPAGWQAAATGGKPANWRVAAVAGAAQGSKVVRLLDPTNQDEAFNLLLSAAPGPADLSLRAWLRADAGKEDQGGGLLWRAADANTYYVTRWNPLEDNLRLYHVVKGVRTELASVDLWADPKAWHEIEVRNAGADIEVWFDRVRHIAHRDTTLTGPGRVGLWTKADAATSFDAVRLGPAPRLPTALERDAADGADFADTPGYRELVRQVAEGRTPRAAPGDPILDYAALRADPERHRGKTVTVRGILVQVVATKLQHPAGAVLEVFRGFVSDTDGGNFIAFDLPKELPATPRLRRDVVEIEGTFYREVRYETRRGRQVDVPYLVARRVTILDGAGRPPR